MINSMNIQWELIINNFSKRNIGVKDLAMIAQVPAQDLVNLVRGDLLEPPFSTGLKLLDAHNDYFPEKHSYLIDNN